MGNETRLQLISDWLTKHDRELFGHGVSIKQAARMASESLKMTVGTHSIKTAMEQATLEWTGGMHREARVSIGRFSREWFQMMQTIDAHRDKWPLDDPHYVAMKLHRINGRRVTPEEAREAIAALPKTEGTK